MPTETLRYWSSIAMMSLHTKQISKNLNAQTVYVCVHVFVCVYVWVYVYVYVCMYVCICVAQYLSAIARKWDPSLQAIASTAPSENWIKYSDQKVFRISPFTPKFKKNILPTFQKEMYTSKVVRIGSKIIFHLKSQVLHTVW